MHIQNLQVHLPALPSLSITMVERLLEVALQEAAEGIEVESLDCKVKAKL
jgi:hypothetical protein